MSNKTFEPMCVNYAVWHLNGFRCFECDSQNCPAYEGAGKCGINDEDEMERLNQ